MIDDEQSTEELSHKHIEVASRNLCLVMGLDPDAILTSDCRFVDCVIGWYTHMRDKEQTLRGAA